MACTTILVYIFSVGYPYGGFMFEFFGKTSPFFIVAMLIVVLIGESFTTRDICYQCLGY